MDASVLRAEIAVLLTKDAIEPVPPAEMKSGFYSPYFIVPKKGANYDKKEKGAQQTARSSQTAPPGQDQGSISRTLRRKNEFDQGVVGWQRGGGISGQERAGETSDISVTDPPEKVIKNDMMLVIRKSRTSLPEDEIESSGIRPNHDGTFQLRRSVEIQEDEKSEYNCFLSHRTLKEPIIITWDN
ncbi:hypothetical protein QQF64_025777 [Cirrhinus molitorella]|uniref:Ig-like domain-containing protein n=1 Tax=Cirrhinus molitorella TaxID=172907 RepID=A0ABR3NPZ5_9TELE